MSAMDMQPHQLYKQIRVPDGEGGYTMNLSVGTTLYGAVRVFEGQTTMIVNREVDVDMEDFIEISTKRI